MENVNHIGIIYTDGSALNPGPYGGGAHGYIYIEDKIEKNNDVPTGIFTTTKGYVRREDVTDVKTLETVKPIAYLDALYSYIGTGTNNMGEVLAVIETIEQLVVTTKFNLTKLGIYTDSMYVINLFRNITKPNSDWANDRNKPNYDLWVRFANALTEASNNGIKVSTIKVKAHDVDFGNNIVDSLALIARERSVINKGLIDFNIFDNGKYWKPKINRHPFLRYNDMFFNGTMDDINGNEYYTIMKYPKDVELGKRSSEVTYAVIKLAEHPKEITDIKNIYNVKTGTTRVISSVNLKNIYSRDFQHYYGLFKEDAITYDKRNFNLELLGNTQVAARVNPPGLANKSLKYTIQLRDYITYYYEKKHIVDFLEFVDVTNAFYEDGKLKITTEKTIDIKDIEVFGKNLTITPQLGIDLIDRLQLKSIEKMKPKISILFIKESERIIRYYFLIELLETGDLGVWTSMYSNFVVIGGKNV